MNKIFKWIKEEKFKQYIIKVEGQNEEIIIWICLFLN